MDLLLQRHNGVRELLKPKTQKPLQGWCAQVNKATMEASADQDTFRSQRSWRRTNLVDRKIWKTRAVGIFACNQSE